MAVAVLTSSLGIHATAPRRPGRTFASGVGGLVLLLSRKGHRDMCKGQGLDVRQKLHIPKHSSATWRLFIVRFVRNFYQQVYADQFKRLNENTIMTFTSLQILDSEGLWILCSKYRQGRDI